MRATLVHNPDAGEDAPSAASLLELLRRHGYRPTHCSTRAGDLRAALQDPGDLVVVAGGDGSVQTVAAHLLDRQIPIGLIPLGTANNLARALGVEGDAEELVAGWREGRMCRVDAGVLATRRGERPFLEGAGAGLFPLLVEGIRTGFHPRSRDRGGQITWARRLWRQTLLGMEPLRTGVVADGRDHSGEYLLAEVLNIPRLGPGLALAPGADPADGWFDLVLVGEGDRGVLASYLDRLLAGGALPPALPVHRVREVVIRPGSLPLHLDDRVERIPADDAARIRVRAGAVCFLV